MPTAGGEDIITTTAENEEDNRTDLEFTMFYVYYVIRCVIAIVGIVGNTLTLITLMKQLKYHSNGHIIMTYMAVSDILVSLTVLVEVYVQVTELFDRKGKYWISLCVVSLYIELIFMATCTLSYVMLSMDR